MSPNLKSAILLIAAVGVFFVVINPQYNKYQDLSSQLTSYNSALDQATRLDTLAQGLLAKYRSITPDQLTTLNKIMPDSVDTVRLILDLNGIASKYGISLQKIDLNKSGSSSGGSVGAGASAGAGSAMAQNAINSQNVMVSAGSAQTDQYVPLGVNFSITTSYNNFMNFIRDIEQSLRIIDITSISLQTGAGSSQGQGNGQTGASGASSSSAKGYTYSVTAQTYSLK
jgi:Tfp pilus assembly protein PilO